MSDQKQYIASVCDKLTRQGKKPSVALIKSAADRALPLPLIISVLKRYQQDPEQFASDSIEEVEPTVESETLEQQVFSLQQRVASLEAQVKLLLDAKG